MFKIIQKHSSELSGLSSTGQSTDITSEQLAAATHFVGLVYGVGACASLNILRRTFVSSGKSKPRRLPPTSDSFLQHLLRCVYQLFIWTNAMTPNMPSLDPSDFGYMQTESGLYKPKYMTQSMAPPELLNDMVCVCEDHCSEDCICSNNEQPCTLACRCKGSLIDNSEICQNLLTMLASISSDDDDDDNFDD